MDTQPHNVSSRMPVRWPFRILATVIVLAGLIAIAGGTLASWFHEAGLTKWQALFALPVITWLIRLAWESAIHGRPPASECWPFASQKVFMVYIIILLVAWYT